MDEPTPAKWQPVMMVVTRRLECKCGALAIFVTGTIDQNDAYNTLSEVDLWCQACFAKAQEEVSDDA